MICYDQKHQHLHMKTLKHENEGKINELFLGIVLNWLRSNCMSAVKLNVKRHKSRYTFSISIIFSKEHQPDTKYLELQFFTLKLYIFLDTWTTMDCSTLTDLYLINLWSLNLCKRH